jgi:hypothetical protein
MNSKFKWRMVLYVCIAYYVLNHSALGIERTFPVLPAALASVPFGFGLVRVRVRLLRKLLGNCYGGN